VAKLVKSYRLDKFDWGYRATTPSGARIIASIREVNRHSWLVSGYLDRWHTTCGSEKEALVIMCHKLHQEGYFLM